MKLLAAKQLAVKLMAEHDLRDWKFEFDNAKRRFGLCSYRKKTISLSKALTELNDEFQIRDTILHEIAHALAGARCGHGYKWRLKAKEIGCTGTRCYSNAVIQPKGKYIYKCSECGEETHYHQRARRNFACRTCCNRYNGGRYSSQFKFELIS